MKNSFYKRFLVSALTVAVLFSNVPVFYADEASLEFDLKPEFVVDYESVKQSFTTIDLTEYCTTTVYDDIAGDGKGGWADQGSANDFSDFKLVGLQKLKGVPFVFADPLTNDGKSVVFLNGRGNKRDLPHEVEIDINKVAGGIYFLHANVWADANGVKCGEYTYVYEDGTEYSVSQVTGSNIPGWWSKHYTDYCIPGWVGENPTSVINASLYACVNPYPDKVISKIRLTSNDYCYMAILGMTLTDIRPILMDEQIMDWGNPDTTDWFRYIPCYDAEEFEGTALDMSWLNEKESTRGHGTLLADGEDMVYEDGTKMIMWGENIQFNEYPSHEESDYEAKRLAQIGVNVVRISSPGQTGGGPNVYSIDHTTSRIIGLHEGRMDKYCYFLYALQREGIAYMITMPNLTRSSRSLDNNVQDIDNTGTGYGLYDPDMIKLNRNAFTMFLNYVNPYTGKKIIEDEGFQMIQLYNECSIFDDGYYKSPYYYEVLRGYFNEWLCEKYSSRDELSEAWDTEKSEYSRLTDEEDQFKGTVKMYQPADYHLISNEKIQDHMNFIADLQTAHFEDCVKYYRDLGFKGIILGSTDYGNRANANVYTNAKAFDAVDYHCYNNLIAWIMPGSSIRNPVSDLESNFSYMRHPWTRKIYNHVQTVNEWNATIPNPFFSETFLMMPVTAAFMNVSPFHFAWNEGVTLDKLRADAASPEKLYDQKALDLNLAPSMLYAMPMMSMIVRRGDITEADAGFYTRVSRNEALDINSQSPNSQIIFGLVGKSGIVYDEDYSEDVNSNDILKLSNIGDKTGVYTSITGEIQTDLNKKLYMVNTERTQAVTGFLNNNSVNLSDVQFNITNPFATVFLSSLSYDSLKDCDSMLLTVSSRYRNFEQIMDVLSKKFLTTVEGPMLIEQIMGEVIIKSYDDFIVYPLDFSGKRKNAIKTTKTEEGYTVIPLTRDDEALNYEIVRVNKSDKRYEGKVDFMQGIDLGNLVDDLGEYEQYRTEIERALLQGFMKTTNERKFSPNAIVTRGQFADMLVKSCGFSGNPDEPFTDVPMTHEYYKSVNTLKAKGIANGSDGCFYPDNPITLEEMAVMVKKSVEVSLKNRYRNNPVNTSSFKDWDNISPFAKESVEFLIAEKYYEPSGNTINAQKCINRAEAAIVIYNILWK